MRLKHRYWLAALLTAAVLGAHAGQIAAASHGFLEHVPGKDYYRIQDEKGNVISLMSLGVSVGDYLITEDNRGYSIATVKGFTAHAKFDKVHDLGNVGRVGSIPGRPWMSQADRAVGPIATYCTHSGESYEPTSGTDNKKVGDIYRVQDQFAGALRKKGFKVIASKDNFNPHDADAYMRSRRTASQLLGQRPSVVVDLHRDGIPNANYYRRQVSGQQIAAIRLVVGKQNANRSVNFEFAKQIKAAADKAHPGLVREIFWARGNYNQDLAPRTILMEFGTHKNNLQEAQKGAALMGDALSVVLTGTQGNRGAGTQGGQNIRSAAGRTIGWILGLVALGAVGFVLLNSGSWDRVKQRFGKFFRQEVGTGPKDDRGEGE